MKVKILIFAKLMMVGVLALSMQARGQGGMPTSAAIAIDSSLLPNASYPYMVIAALRYADSLAKSAALQKFTDSTGCAVHISGSYNQAEKPGEQPEKGNSIITSWLTELLGQRHGEVNQPRIGVELKWKGLASGFREGQPAVSTRMEATTTVGSHFVKEGVDNFTNAIESYSDTSLSIIGSHADHQIITELHALSKLKVEKNQIVMIVNRVKHNSVRTISTFSINDECTGYIMERDGRPPEKETIKGSLKRIKAGTYEFEITTVSNKEQYANGKSLRMNNVQGRTGILVHRGINQNWSEGCLIVVPERFASLGFTYAKSEKKQLENEAQQEVDRVIRYIKIKKDELEKKYKKETKMIIIINQSKEVQD